VGLDREAVEAQVLVAIGGSIHVHRRTPVVDDRYVIGGGGGDPVGLEGGGRSVMCRPSTGKVTGPPLIVTQRSGMGAIELACFDLVASRANVSEQICQRVVAVASGLNIT
jgi:hypothetical protein